MKNNMKNKIDTSKMPKVPTFLSEKDGFDTGWYGVMINTDGISYTNNSMVKHKTFEKCLTACNVHNEWLGLSSEKIVSLYSQHRMSHL